jgi:hypothetical protein
MSQRRPATTREDGSMTDEPRTALPPAAGPAATGAIETDDELLGRARLLGAALGLVLATAAIVIAVRIDAVVSANPLESPIAAVFGEQGIGRGDPVGTFLVWAVAPTAAAIAGFVFGVPAIRRVDGSGLWMGSATYVIAIGIAPITLLPQASHDGIDLSRDLAVVPFLWLLSGAALGPLLAVCLIAGPVWAHLVRVVAAGRADVGASPRTLPLWPVVALVVCVLFGWAIVMALLGAVGTAPGVD